MEKRKRRLLARRFCRKPYSTKEIVRFREEFQALPAEYVSVIASFVDEHTTDDAIHEMIICCYEAWGDPKRNAASRAKSAIQELILKQRREYNALYNPYRNISFNQCIGDSKTPVSEWLNISDWREWD